MAQMSMEGRKKTTFWFNEDLLARFGELAADLGVSNTAYLHLAAAHFMAVLAPATRPGVKRKQLIAVAEKSFKDVVELAKKKA